MRRLYFGTGLTACLLTASVHAATATLEVDARDAARGIERVHEIVAVKPGDLTLLYPKWLPGEHQPNGPIGSVAGLKFLVGSKPLAWQRDAVNMFAFHLVIPSHTDSLDITFEIDSTASGSPPNALRTATEALAIIHWNELLFYPAGTPSDDMALTAVLHLPAGWSYGTALPKGAGEGEGIRFGQVSLTTLIDSPVLAGRHFRTVELGGTPAVYLHLAGDSAASIDISPKTSAQMRKLVAETNTLFGAAHYNEYHFLWTLSDQIGAEGIEHHQSSDNRSAERSLIDDNLLRSSFVATLLPHEYFHAWNGKYRRPAGLATGNYDAPMRGELLWVYEGLTEYYGLVLGARAGLASPDDARDSWANVAARLDVRKGREWRPLIDTSIGAPMGYSQSAEWLERTRGIDFYEETAMLWLEADALIRTRSNGTKSLDDFAKAFAGPPAGSPRVVPYDTGDIVRTLNGVLPYDWRGFWTERLNRLRPKAPLEALSASGWHLRFDAEQGGEQRGDDAFGKRANYAYSLGFSVGEEGDVITDPVPGSPADVAGLSPGSHLIAVDGRKYSKDVLADALKAGGPDERTVKLLVQKEDIFNTYELRYGGHARYPHLERDASTRDLLTAILAARTD